VTLDELKDHLRAAGLTPICVRNQPPRDEGRLMLVGGLPAYHETARAVSVKTVIIYSRVFEESDFVHLPGHNDDDTGEFGEVDAEPVDLRTANEALNKFKRFIGLTAAFHLSMPLESDYLDVLLEEDWWLQFLGERSLTTDEWERTREQKVAVKEADEEARNESLIARLHGLANDSRFARLPTQKAMLQYALRQIPELESIDQSDLKIEIQEIKAKIDAAS
jgi:hypothetical protein